MVVEVDVSNPEYLLLPGMYAQIQFTDKLVEPPLLVPGDSIMATANGLEVGILLDPTPQQRQKLQEQEQQAKKDRTKESSKKEAQAGQPESEQAKRIHIQKIEVGRDYGLETEVTAGLEGWEYVVTNPGDAVEENALVIPQAAPPIAGAGGAQRRSQSDQRPSGIGAPSMAAPTQGAPQQTGGHGGKRDGNQGGSEKGNGH